MLVVRLLLLICLATPVWGSVDAKRQALEDLRQRIAQLKKEIEQAADDRSEAADALEQSERRISDINRSLHELDAHLRKLNKELRALSASMRQTQADLAVQQERLVQLLRASYAQVGNDALRLLLSGRNPTEISRLLVYLRYVGQARQDLVRNYQGALARLRALEAQTRAHKQYLDQMRAQQLSQKKVLEAEIKRRRAILNKLSAQIRMQRRQISTLVRDEQRLSRLIERLDRLAAESAQKSKLPGQQVTEVADASLAKYAFEQLKGRLALPVAGEIVSRYGQPRKGGGPAWKGLFIRAPQGREVRAVGNGRVVFADWLRGFGNLLILDHGNGFMSLYSNNESLYKRVGELVRAGDVIATVGNTGGQEEPGLYFELRRNGQPFDPLSWVKPGFSG